MSVRAPGMQNADPPHEGEMVMFCGHLHVGPDCIDLSKNKPQHWYFLGHGNAFKRIARLPGDTEVPMSEEWVTCEWAWICQNCHDKLRHNKNLPLVDVIRQHTQWIGKPPEIVHYA